MKTEFFGITIGTFENIIYFPFLFIIIFLLIYKIRKKNRVIKLLVSPVNQNNLLLNYSRARNITKSVLLFMSLLFLFFSLLSPQWNDKEENVQQEGRDIYIALDVSRSMLATDFKPNRLEWAKTKIKELLKLLKGDRVGLILFSGSAFIQCPLTKDVSAFQMFLDQADTQMVSNGTTSIDQAIKLALEKFNSNQSRKNKLLIIFTDGEDFSSDLSNVKEEAIKQELKIFTVGVGTSQGAPIPVFDENNKQIGYQLNSKGTAVISQLNEGILKSISQNAEGVYIHGTQNDNDINEIANKVEQFEKEKFEDRKFSHLEEQYSYFILISFFFLLIEWIL